MQIGIDGNEANIEQRVGIGEYAYQLINHLSIFQNKHKFTIYLKESPKADLPKGTSNWQYLVFGPKPLWTQIALPVKLYTSPRLDLFFSPTHYAPRFSPVPSIISIMDLSYIYYPQLFKKSDLLQLKRWTSYSIKQAAKIITISNFSKNSIVDYYKINPDNIYVTYPGYKKQIYNQKYTQEEIKQVKSKFNLTDYLIFVGTIQPRKNIVRLIDAFSKIMGQFPSFKLVLVGRKGWLYEEIFKQINQAKLKDRVIFLDYLEDRTIAKLYNGASSFVLPSLYEGFGLTVIEAMACGCPVITSNVSSLPEIAKDAAVYVEPKSVSSISQGILKVIRQDQKYFRESLIKKGLTRANDFSWEACALKTLKFFESI